MTSESWKAGKLYEKLESCEIAESHASEGIL